MLIQSTQRLESAGTERACVAVSVPGALGGESLRRVVAGERDHRFGDYVIAVHTLNHGVDFVPVEMTFAAGAGFEVDRYT